MNMIEALTALKEVGIPVAAFALCAWMVVYIVKRLARVIDKLSAKMDVFTNRVRDEHDRAKEHHERLMAQHDEMIKTLGRINGYRKSG